jgi:hypothetical protein
MTITPVNLELTLTWRKKNSSEFKKHGSIAKSLSSNILHIYEGVIDWVVSPNCRLRTRESVGTEGRGSSLSGACGRPELRMSLGNLSSLPDQSLTLSPSSGLSPARLFGRSPHGGKARASLERVELQMVADEFTARIAPGLIIPRRGRADREGCGDEMAAMLAFADGAIEGRQVPTPGDLVAKRARSPSCPGRSARFEHSSGSTTRS